MKKLNIEDEDQLNQWEMLVDEVNTKMKEAGGAFKWISDDASEKWREVK